MEADRDQVFMRAAIDQAQAAAAKGQTPFGALVVGPSGAVVGEGHNQVRADRDPAAHGEIVAMRDGRGSKSAVSR